MLETVMDFQTKKLITILLSKDALHWSKNDSKDIYNVTKDFYFK